MKSGTALAVGAALPLPPLSAWPLPERRAVNMTENEWIRVRDGTRLACRLWRPDGAAPVGVVLEALPYSKRDGTRAADDLWAAQFVPHGFAYVRLDLRGTGESEGLLDDEYLAQEQQDIIDAIAHLAAQPWCNGAVGMRGYSWGGFNGLQVAMHRPPALKAIVTACSSHDRYLNDAHYVGGVPSLANLQWGTMFRNVLADAPDPAIVGDGWRDQWIDRLRAVKPLVGRWLDHPTRDDYWKHGSVAVDYRAIDCAVYAVGGQMDAYSSAVIHLLERLDCPRKGLIGPWTHHFPQFAAPGPGLDWVVEEVRWWAHWLHGADSGIMREPMLRAYVNHRTPVEAWPADVPGQWISEESWPTPHVRDEAWHLDGTALSPTAGKDEVRDVPPSQTVGIARREWLPMDPTHDLPGEQSADDRMSLTFESDPLDRDIDILGLARLSLRVAADRPVAKLVARLNEVRPDGSSWPVAYGVLNLTHRDGHAHPVALEPGAFYDVALPFKYAAHRFEKGNRIRLALSESLWPMLAPSPATVRMHVATGASALHLPIRAPRSEKAVPWATPILHDRNVAPDDAVAASDGDALVQTGGAGAATVGIVRHAGPYDEYLADIDTHRTGDSRMEAHIADDDHATSVWRVAQSAGSSRADWSYRTESATELRVEADMFVVRESLSAFEGEKCLFEHSTETRISRVFS